jgi:hypothetical protein
MPLPRARSLAAVLAGSVWVLALVADFPGSAHATPPQPPLDLRLVLLETPVPGRPVPFAVEVTPGIPADRLTVTVVPRRDAVLVRGPARWSRAAVAAGRSHRLEGALRVTPGRRHHVYVRAEIVTPAGHRYTRGEHLVVLAGPLAVPDPPARTVADGRGGTLVEYDGRQTP